MRKINIMIIIVLFLSFVCCASKAKYFTNYYTGKYTGLDTLINLQGYYISPIVSLNWKGDCYSGSHTMTMFYNNGLVVHSTNPISADPSDFAISVFEGREKSSYARLQWGSYVIKDDTIKVQINVPLGFPYPSGTFIGYADFKLLPEGRIQLVSDYILGDSWYQDTKVYPDCGKPSVFFPLETKADSTKCPLLKKKWFWDKEAYENRIRK